MTFEGMASWQAGTLFAAVAPAAVGLFLVKLRAPTIPAASLLLWRRVLDSSRELTLWERIRRAVSLAATVAVALLLALAVTRPGRAADASGAAGGRLLVVLDASWSMQARTATGETRWERAIAEARRLTSGAAGSEVALATTADGIVEGPTTDASLIEAALDRIRAGGADRTAWPRLPGAAAIHFITDGAMARALDAGITVHSVFDPVPNVAIVAFGIRPSLSQREAGDAYIEIANFAPVAQKVRVTLTRGSADIFDQHLEIAASGALRQVVPIARGGDAVLRARIDAAGNALALDDEAVAWMDRATPLAVTIVGPETAWLRRAFDGNPDVDTTFVDPAAFEAAPPAASRQPDAFVFDGWAPAAPPGRPALLFAPPASTPWLTAPPRGDEPNLSPVPSDEERRPRWTSPAPHRVLLGVDPYTLVIDRARPYTSPTLLPIARSDRGTPLVYISDAPDRRVVVVAFGPGESNLTSAPGFPVLLSNALEWLARPSPLPAPSGAGALPPASLKPGLADFDPAVLTVRDPGGAQIPLVRTANRTVGLLPVPGFYSAEGNGFRSTVAVNAGDPELSNLTRTTLMGSAGATPVARGRTGRPWWVYFAIAALLLVSVEWWTWQRRVTV
jgi:hypothetical protein